MTPDFLNFVIRELLERGDVLKADSVTEEIRRITVRLNLPFLSAAERGEIFPLEASNLTFHPVWFDSNGRRYGKAFVSVELTAWPNESYVVILKESIEELLSQYAQLRTFKLDSGEPLSGASIVSEEIHE